MCDLKFSKTILPFTFTFLIGLLLVSLFLSPTPVRQGPDLGETLSPKVVREQKSTGKTDCGFGGGQGAQLLKTNTENIIIRPTLTETIVINEETRRFQRSLR